MFESNVSTSWSERERSCGVSISDSNRDTGEHGPRSLRHCTFGNFTGWMTSKGSRGWWMWSWFRDKFTRETEATKIAFSWSWVIKFLVQPSRCRVVTVVRGGCKLPNAIPASLTNVSDGHPANKIVGETVAHGLRGESDPSCGLPRLIDRCSKPVVGIFRRRL